MSDDIATESAAAETPAAAEPVQNLEDVLTAQMGDTFDKIEARERAPDKDAAGRFVSATPAAQAPAEAAPAAPNTVEPTPKDGEQAPPASAPPDAWTADAKAKWAALPPDVQTYIAAREKQTNDALSQKGQELAKFEPLGRVLQPHMGRLSQAGIAPPEYVNRLLNADAALANPATRMEAIQHVAQLYGIDLRQLAGQSAGHAAAPQAPADPALAALFEQVNGIKSWVSHQVQQTEARNRATAERETREVNAQAQAFLNDPKFPYAKDVREEVAAHLDAAEMLGQKITLEQAYNRAVRANDAIWSKMEAEKAAVAKKAADEADAKKAAEARRRAPTIVKPRGSGAVAPSSAATWEERMNEVYDRTTH